MNTVQQLAWTPEMVGRFWDYWSTRTETYFSHHFGRGVARFLSYAAPLQGALTLDFGAGPGLLADQLLNEGARLWAVDYSPQTLLDLDRKFAGRAGWQGAKMFDGGRLPWPDNTFDVVCCLETIEHVLDEHAQLIFQELHRVLKIGGVALFTTPNSENLRDATVFCPCCQSEFHRWQHVRSWTPEQLRAQLRQESYDVAFCEGLNFGCLQNKRLFRKDRELWWSLLALIGWQSPVRLPHRSLFHKQLFRDGRPHLAAVAVKSAAGRAQAPLARRAA